MPEDTKDKIVTALGDLVRALCGRPDDVVVKASEGARAITVSVFVHDRDYGRVIGAKAQTFKAFDLLVKLMAAQAEKEGQLSVVTPKTMGTHHHERFVPNPKWGKAQLSPMIKAACALIFPRGGVVELQEPDPATLNVEIKVNDEAESELAVYRSGSPSRVAVVKDAVTHDDVETPITFQLVEKSIGTIAKGIGRNNGRTVNTYVVPVRYPKATAA